MGTIELNTISTGQNTFNLNSNGLKNFRAAAGKIRAAMAGVGTQYRSTIVCIGDSKTMGAGADGSAGNTAGAEPFSWPSFLCTELTARGLNNTRNATFGFRGLTTSALFALYDTRFVVDANMFASAGNPATLGGYSWRLGSTTVQQFTPTGSVDTVDLFTRQSLGLGDGIMGLKVDAGAELVSVNCDGASNVVIKTSVALGSLATHAIQFYRKSGGFAYTLGLRAYNSTTSGFEIVNAGAYGTESGFHVGGSWTADQVLPKLNNVSLVIIQLGTNDLGNGTTPLATTLANYQVLITAAQAVGADVVLMYPTYGPDGQFGTPTAREALRQGMISLAYANNCVLLDNATRFISYASSFGLGMMGSSVHETGAGYADIARFSATTLLDR